LKVIDKNSDLINDFAEKLKLGELIVIPTETVYGLAANALDENAVKKIFATKGRPQDNPLIIHTYSKEKIFEFTQNQSDYIGKLIDTFMPGPLTLVLDKNLIIPSIVSAGLNTVAIRIPNNEVTLKLLELVDLPLAAPSANKSGRPSPTKAQHILDDYKADESIYGLIDDGDCEVGIESTIIKCESDKIIILRPGKVSKEDLENVVDVKIEEYIGKELLSPGMKYKHYSPDIPVQISKDVIDNDNTLNISYIKSNIDTMKFDESNIYRIFRDAEKGKFSKINIIETKELLNNIALYNRIKKATNQ
jgi:L-threonylcarbamoyladenylate synthase